MSGTGATRLLRSGFCSLTTGRPGGKLQLWTLSCLVLLLPTPGATNHPREGSQGWNRQLPLWGKAPAPTEMWRCLSIFFLSMEGSIQTSLFSWLRFPQNFLRLCHSHVFGGSNHGDVCCGSKSNPIWRFFFWWRQLDVVEFAFWFLLVGDLSTTSCFFLFFEFSHYGGIGHKQKVAKMIDRKFMDFIWVLQFFDTNLDFAGSKANQCRSFLHG